MRSANLAHSSSASGVVADRRLLDNQRMILEQWLGSPEARTYADRLARRRHPSWTGQDLISEAWLRVDKMLAVRTTPMDTMEREGDAARYLARTLDNVSRDIARREMRRTAFAASLAEQTPRIPHRDDASENSSVLLIQVLAAVGRRAQSGIQCRGCEANLVASAALETIHLIIAGHGGGNDSGGLDRILAEALMRMSPHMSSSAEALRQRKARCGPCVTELIRSSLNDMGIAG